MMSLSKNVSRFMLSVFTLSLACSMNLAVPQKIGATAYAPDFQAGNIIGDALFFDSGTMNAGQIQQFLNDKMPSCDVNGSKTSEYGGGTRAQYGASRGYPAPYVCLRNYIENPTTHANNLSGSVPDGGWSAAQIISNASTTYGINPKVLLTTLQKESSLVTDDWPFPSEYKVAMGYGCPDTAPCDAQYYGFYNQVTNAAQQFKRYATSASSFRYKANQANSIYYNPSASCGASSVFVQNQATAGLYNYTPYQPNAAALGNLYGSGDSCSAYGNRNFWRMYTDWFGSTLGSDLVRTANDATVYLISGPNKYPIGDGSVLNDFSSLGNVLYVSDSYTAAHTTGPLLGHMVGGSDGTIYFVNAGIKLPFNSCGNVEDYGYNCNSIIYLNDIQLSKLASGPRLTSVYQTTSGKTFYISGGIKREVFDQQSLAQAGINEPANRLLEAGISYLSYGSPVVRDAVTVNTRDGTGRYLYDSGSFYRLDNSLLAYISIKNLQSAYLDGLSVPTNQVKLDFTGFIGEGGSTNSKYIITSSGKAKLNVPTEWASVYTVVSSNLINALPVSSEQLDSQLVKSPNDGTVYYVTSGKKRPISAWSDLLSLHINPLTITTLADIELKQLPQGVLFYGIGSYVKTPSSGTVYIVQSTNKLLSISSFLFPQELGVNSYVRTMSDTDLQSYTVSSDVKTQISCQGSFYVGTLGKLFPLTAGQITQYGFSTQSFIDAQNLCATLPLNQSLLGDFIRTPDGTIYLVEGGQKKAFTSYNLYSSHGGTAQNTVAVSNYFASLISSGPNVQQ